MDILANRGLFRNNQPNLLCFRLSRKCLSFPVSMPLCYKLANYAYKRLFSLCRLILSGDSDNSILLNI